MVKRKQFNCRADSMSLNDFNDFNAWCKTYPGKKQEQIGAAFKAIQVLCSIDKALLFRFMLPNLTLQNGRQLIIDAIKIREKIDSEDI